MVGPIAMASAYSAASRRTGFQLKMKLHIASTMAHPFAAIGGHRMHLNCLFASLRHLEEMRSLREGDEQRTSSPNATHHTQYARTHARAQTRVALHVH